MTDHAIGICKSHLVVFHPEGQVAQRFQKAPFGHRALRKRLAQLAVRRMAFEPTGPGHHAVERARAGKPPLVWVNPMQARRFAHACGTRASTDAVDARILARMGAAPGLGPDAPASENLHDLRD